MLILHTSDLMGRAGHFAALQQRVTELRPDVLTLGGNMLPDDPSRLPDEMGRRQPQYVNDTFRRWLGELHRAAPALHVVMVFGNHDWLSSALSVEELARQMPHLHLPRHDKPATIGGLSIVGYSCTPPTPAYTKDYERLDLPGDLLPLVGGARWDVNRSRAQTAPAKQQYQQFPTITEDMEQLAAPAGPWVFLAHCPPAETPLDQNYQREPVGSRAIRKAIETRQPIVSLHGHATASPDVSGACETRLGATAAVNVGQHADGLCFALVEIDVAAKRLVRIEPHRPV